MPNAVGIKQFLAPSKGLITEQTPLSPVEGSTIDETNMDFSASMAVRRRRKGLNQELTGNPLNLAEDYQVGDAVDHYLWESVNGDGDVSFHVFQVGRYLYFVEDKDTPLSSGTVGWVFNLDNLLSGGATLSTTRTVRFDFASGKGALIVVSDQTEPAYIEWDPEAEQISARPFTLLVRDLVGVEDELGTDERPDTLSDEHGYNLRNQTWKQSRKRKADDLEVDPITQFEIDVGDYPSNADISYLGMVDNGAGLLRFDGESIEDLTLGNTPAPKGHFIIDAFEIKYNDIYTGIIPASPAVGGFAGRLISIINAARAGTLPGGVDTTGSDDEGLGGGSTPIFGEPGGKEEF